MNPTSASTWAKLHTTWLHRLSWEYRSLNRDRLRLALYPAVITLDIDPTSRLGRWDRETRTIAISEHHVLSHAWDDVVETLAHEMAHQFADEVLHATEETAHGRAFADACRRLHIEPRATGVPSRPHDGAVDRVLQKVRKLLALAESHNVHEAQAAMAMANRLLLEHNLELAAATAERSYAHRRIGGELGRVSIAHKLVAAILAEHFFVECLWIEVYLAREDQSRRTLEIVGTLDNLEMAHYVHDFLHAEADLLWKREKKTLPDRSAAARREFLAGVLLGFRDSLRRERTKNEEKGLVWVGDPGLKAFFKQRWPRTTSMSRSHVGRTRAHEAGRAAGSALKLRRGIHQHGPGGRLLGSGS